MEALPVAIILEHPPASVLRGIVGWSLALVARSEKPRPIANKKSMWNCPKHGADDLGFAFACSHLISGEGRGFHIVPDEDENNEPRPPAICDECEERRKQDGAYNTTRICGVCYDEIKRTLWQDRKR